MPMVTTSQKFDVPVGRVQLVLTVECERWYYDSLDEAMRDSCDKSLKDILHERLLSEVTKIEEQWLARQLVDGGK